MKKQNYEIEVWVTLAASVKENIEEIELIKLKKEQQNTRLTEQTQH